MARWKKLGRVCPGDGHVEWAATHAALPIVEPGESSVCRVYFSARDGQGRSHIGAGRLDLDCPDRMLSSPALLLAPGSSGAFDESGVTSSCLVVDRERLLLYYTGWTRGVTVPFYFYVGMATSEDQGRTFRRISRAPILDRNDVDPFLTASPWVLVEDGVWRMWYVSCVRWVPTPEGATHHYHVKYAESRDGFNWLRHGVVCLDFQTPDEHAFGRPCVLKDADGVYRMWYCVRGARYRLGYAESGDGIHWRRDDESAGLEASADDWDAEMIAYPMVFDRGGRRFMLYNGNGYGRTGMGLAVQVPADQRSAGRDEASL